MSEKKDFRAIYKRVLSHCQPYSHGGAWQALPVRGGICRPPADAAAVLSALQEEFSLADLQESGVLAMDETLAVGLDPALCDQSTLVIPLRRAAKADPFELVSGHGTVSGRWLPLCASMQDERVHKLIVATAEKILCVATRPADAALLLSVNIPATLATGLAELGGKYLKQVRKWFDLYPPQPPQRCGIIDEAEEEKKRERQPPDLLLVDCSLAEMSVESPVGLSAMVSHLAKVEEYLDVPLDRFYRWRPTQREIATIEFRLKHAGPAAVRAAILESIEASTTQLIAHTSSDGMPKDLATAIQQLATLLSARDRDRNRDKEQKAWKNIQSLMNETCVTSMFKAAETSSNPIEKNLWLLAATNGQLLYTQAMQLLFKTIGDARDKGPGRLILLSDIGFRQQMAGIDRQLKIFKDIRQCRKNS